MMRNRPRDKIPKNFGVIKLTDVAQFVDDQIILKLGRKQSQLVVKIQVPFFGTTAPAGGLIFYADRPNVEAVNFIEARDSIRSDRQGFGLIFDKHLLACHRRFSPTSAIDNSHTKEIHIYVFTT